MKNTTRRNFRAERNNEKNHAGRFCHALTTLCICNRQQTLNNLPEKVPKGIERQRFFPANSLN